MAWFFFALIGLGLLGLLSENQRQQIERLELRIRTLEDRLAEIEYQHTQDLGRISAQINMLADEIRTLRRLYANDANMNQALDVIESKMREIVRRKKEAVQYAYA